MQIKWKTLKNRAADCAYNQCDLYNYVNKIPAPVYAVMASIGNDSAWRSNLKEMQALAVRTVNQWDIRCAMQLVKAFPSVLPKKYHSMTPTADMNDAGDWVLYFDEGTTP